MIKKKVYVDKVAEFKSEYEKAYGNLKTSHLKMKITRMPPQTVKMMGMKMKIKS